MDQRPGLKLNIEQTGRAVINEPIANHYFLTPNLNKDSLENFEAILPVLFIAVFLLLLFAIYLINTYCLTGSKQASTEVCCLYTADHELPQPMIYAGSAAEAGNLIPARGDNYRRSTMSTNSYKYCEEPRFAHNPGHNYVARTFNHNYDKIYDSHPSNLILALQAKNHLINQSGNTTGYELPSMEEPFPKCSKRPLSNNLMHHDHSQQYIDLNQSHANRGNFILKARGSDLMVSSHHAANTVNEDELYRELSVLRRSYSNSRLNHEKWQRAIAQQRPHMYSATSRPRNWPSTLMTQHQMNRLLVGQNNRHQPQSKMHSFQVLRSESLLKTASSCLNQQSASNSSTDDQTNSHGLNSHPINYSMIQSLRDDSLNIAEERRSNIYHTVQETQNRCSLAKSDLISEKNEMSTSDVSSSGTATTGDKRNKSYSGILASNKEYSSYFENQEFNLNRSELNLERSEYRKLQPFNELCREKKSSKTKKFSSEYRTKKRVQCSESLSESSSVLRFAPSKDQDIVRRLSNKLKEKNKDGKKARLCKSFTFLSQPASEKSKHTAFISEPNKLSLLPLSIKSQQSNYLKNLNAFRAKSGMYSESASSLVLIRSEKSATGKVNNECTECKCVSGHDSKATGNDAAVQTSIVSEGSSFNSQLTTLMQTNTYGSILGNFGSASIRQNAVSSRRLQRLRAYSEGHGLADSLSPETSPNIANINNIQSVDLLPQQQQQQKQLHESIPFSKLIFSQVETFI